MAVRLAAKLRLMLSNTEVINVINNINNTYKRNINNLNDSYKRNGIVQFHLNGGCYIFAKRLRGLIGGNLRYLTLNHHFVVEYNGKLYDASGNVTNQYKDSKYITEEEFKQRDKLAKSIKS